MVEKPTHGWGHSASPVVSGNTVMVHILDVVAFDKTTGKELWRTPSKEGWGSPVATKIGNEPVLITATDADVIRVSDGKKLAEKVGGLQYSTPVILDGIMYLIEGKARALKIPTEMSDTLVFETVWESDIKGRRHYASSAIGKDLIYAASAEGKLTVMERKDGKVVYEQELGISDNRNSIYPSVSVAGDHVFIGSEEGVTVVIKPGREYKEVARNELEKYRGTPVFIKDRIYIRGLEYTWCLSDSDSI